MKWLKVFLALFCILGILHEVSAQEIKLGVILAKTGKASLTDSQLLKSVHFAAAEINDQGGLLGRKMEIFEYDNLSSALGARAAAKKAIRDNVIAVIGASWSSHSLAMAPLLDKAQIPMISPISTNPEVTLQGKYIFRVCFTDNYQGKIMAKFAMDELQYKKAVVLTNVSSKYSIGLAKFFEDEYKRLGGRILAEIDYLEKDTDYMEIIRQLKVLAPEAIYLPGYDNDSAKIIKKARESGITAVFLGGDGWSKVMYGIAGDIIEGNYFTNHWHRDVVSKKSKTFVKDYESVNGKLLVNGLTLSYDAVGVFADAVKRANSLDRPKIRDALAATKEFQGVTGNISFDRNGDPVKPVVILKFQDRTSVFVKSISP